MVPMHLTAVRYKVEPDGPWTPALAVGSLQSIEEEIEPPNSFDLCRLEIYEDRSIQKIAAARVRLPDGRVYDVEAGGYVEEAEAHA